MVATFPTSPGTTLLSEKHVKYWLRSFRSVLPQDYTYIDAQRMTLGSFILSALDLLDILHHSPEPTAEASLRRVTDSERQDCIAWIYHCQHPHGGFRGFPATMMGVEKTTAENDHWDPATLPATWFALSSLIVLGDGLERVDRRGAWKWLKRLQNPDGSFGELLGEDGRIEGGGDPRFAYFGAGLRWLLLGQDGQAMRTPDEDIDVQGLESFITSCMAFDGGIAESPHREAHAGLTYCGIGALAFLDRLPPSSSSRSSSEGSTEPFLAKFGSTVNWLVSRQVLISTGESYPYGEDESGDQVQSDPLEHQQQRFSPAFDSMAPYSTNGTLPLPPLEVDFSTSLSPLLVQRQPHNPPLDIPIHLRPCPQTIPFDPEPPKTPPLPAVGFNGRPSKPADTCYSFWVSGSLQILGLSQLVSPELSRRYLLDHTQHSIVGGFGKVEGDVPDILHSYLGLATLAMYDACQERDGLSPLDPVLCISKRARKSLVESRWWRGDRQDGREEK